MHDDVLERISSIAGRLSSSKLEKICMTLEALPPGTTLGVAKRKVSAHLSGDQWNQLRKIMDAWWKDEPIADGRSLASGLRAAAHVHQIARRRQKIDLAWTGPAPQHGTFRHTQQALVDVIEASTKRLWLVSFIAYAAPKSVRQALISAVDRGVVLNVVLETIDKKQEKSTLDALQGLGNDVANLATVYVWPADKRKTNEKGQSGSLHVKCALADDRKLFITSANLTGYAMDLNMELGLMVSGGDLPKRMLEHLDWLVRRKYLVAREM